ncbi:MAG: alpha/beta hydrolase [Anaerolineae bacterium]|nr:alpha/beta hydrolase [Candidatus Roseilinea sp.]MDW8451207.1 alpha/beta hydrolase [Anaerolineae bacterium]
MQRAFVTLSGLRIHYYRAGEGGSPVILLHGGGLDSAMLSWKLAMPALAQAHCVFAPEMPGYGESDRPAHFDHAIESYGRILHGFMEALDIARASFAGVSMGGALTLHMGLAYPERVIKLVPVASYGLQRTAPAHLLSYLLTRTLLLTRLIYPALRNNRAWVRASLSRIFADPTRLTDDLVDSVCEEIRKPKTGEAFAAFQRRELLPDRLRTNYLARLGEIAAPTCFVHGDKDALVPVACAREAAARLPGASLRVMHNCGHWPQRERPEEFNAIVTEFLND